MFNIEKELTALGSIKHRPDETLRQRTLDKLLGHARGAAPRKLRTLRWATVPAAAAILAAILLLVVLPGIQPTSYFTIDINPSIGIETDASGVILSVKAQNGDAEDLLAELDLTGLPFVDALQRIVQAAEEQGYLKDNGHVLVAHFGVSAPVSEEEIETAVLSSTHRQVNVLLLESDKSDYQDADAQHQSAGVSLLMKNARSLGLENLDINTIINAVKKNHHGNNGDGSQNGTDDSPSATETTRPSSSHVNNGNNNNNGSSDNNGHSNNNSNTDNPGSEHSTNNGGNTNNGNHNGSTNEDIDNSGSNGQSDKEDKPNDGGSGD